MTTILLLIIGSLVVWAVVGTIVIATRDGFHRLPCGEAFRRSPVNID